MCVHLRWCSRGEPTAFHLQNQIVWTQCVDTAGGGARAGHVGTVFARTHLLGAPAACRGWRTEGPAGTQQPLEVPE